MKINLNEKKNTLFLFLEFCPNDEKSIFIAFQKKELSNSNYFK